MNLNPMREVDFLCYGDVVVMPDEYFAAYETVTQNIDEAKNLESPEQQSLDAFWLMLTA